MFQSEELNRFLATSYTVKSQSHVFAEINLNNPDNIECVGAYRYRPNDLAIKYRTLPTTFDRYDSGDYYTDSDLSYAEIGGTYNEGTDLSNEVIFRQTDNTLSLLYSLEDCLRHNRPRSGINKLLYLGSSTAPQFIDGSSKNPAARPRFYISSKDDYFKYWTSYKREGTKERGISYKVGDSFPIDDAVPFVVYKDEVPANRIVIKMQTFVGEEDRGSIVHNETYMPDPFYGDDNKRVPSSWHVEVLRNGSWAYAYTFTGASQIPSDGQVELGYGIVIPSEYLDNYMFRAEVTSTSLLPLSAPDGDLYLVRKSDGDLGEFWIAINFEGSTTWKSFLPQYGWTLESDGFTGQSRVVTKLVDPKSYGSDGVTFREFQMIGGIRIVVNEMNVNDAPFDLIEMSPRLVMDWTDRTESLSITKSMADLSGSAVPVGSLMASTGTVALNNSDSAFNTNNLFDAYTGVGSIICNMLNSRIKVSFYESIVDVNGYDYYVPIKTLYTESNLNMNNQFSSIELQLRDLYFLFESITAPSIIMTDVSLSRAVMTLMDYIGFTNFAFKRVEGQQDPIIPYFFIPHDKNVAEIMISLAEATQSAMYLDEYNNLIIATKEYMLPDAGVRATDMVIRGNDKDGELANIKEISSADRRVYNAGKIDFTKRYIQRTYGSLSQAMYQPQDKVWMYAPSLVWEVSGDQSTKAVSDTVASQSNYTLTAMPLSTNLSDSVPTVVGGVIVNNVIDVGEAANYVARYNGYLYADGEIIKYDAVQYSITGTGNVWIKSVDEYQNYILALPFGGKMYPTGLIRIWTEPYYVSQPDGTATLQAGGVKKHGRAQFGTKITWHYAGVSDQWTKDASIKGIIQDPETLFNMREEAEYQAGLSQNGSAGKVRGPNVADTIAKQATRNGIIKNNLSQKFWSESDINRMTAAKAGTVQSSALVFAGPSYPSDLNPKNHVSYIYKPLDTYYTNFGTRCRIIGKVESGANQNQNPVGSTTYFSAPSKDPSSQMNISGGSGGVAIHVNPDTNAGYFFEIAALTSADPSSYKIPDTEIESDLGKITGIELTDNVVRLTIDQSALKVVPTLSLYNNISVSAVGSTEQIDDGLGGTTTITTPNVNGIFMVEDITSSGTVLTYTLPIIAYTWLTSFGSMNKGGTDFGTIKAASVDDKNIVTITTENPTGLFVNDLVTISGFSLDGSVPNINQSDMKVLSVSADTRTVTIQVPKLNHSFLATTVENAEIKKVTSQKATLSNIWFYKTVADDLGGKVLRYQRYSGYTDITVDSHRLSAGDFVTVKLNSGDINGGAQVISIVGNVIRINRGGSAVTITPSAQSTNGIGLTNPVATTYKLWSGLTNILVDSGQFWGQYRSVAESNTTVYDLGVEFVDSTFGRTFYLYINNKQVATVVDKQPLAKFNNMALFVRGKTKMMFENVYAMGENVQNNSVANQVGSEYISTIFGIPDGINESEALRKYAVSGFVQSGYLSGITNQRGPKYNMYYDEFGTIMREAAYFNILYDKAYPAIYAKLAPVLNRIKGYTVSGFYAGSYGAEFMIFNNLDNLCSLDPTTGNYLRINGVVFTQNTTKSLTVDEYIKNVTERNDGREILRDPNRQKELYDSIKMSRMKYGRNEFQIASDYIQTDDAAMSLMEWIVGKVSRPRKNIGVSLFPVPTMQLGDIVSVDYTDGENNVLTEPEKQFVAYQIEYRRSASDATMTVYVTET